MMDYVLQKHFSDWNRSPVGLYNHSKNLLPTMAASLSRTTLRDDGHGERVLSGFEDLRLQDSCTDFSLHADGRTFRVHRQLLAVVSEYFRGCFRSGMVETQTDAMTLQNVSARGLDQVLNFIYTGAMSLSKKNINDVLEAVVFLTIHPAVKLCCEYLVSNIKMKLVGDYHRLADLYHLKEFRDDVDAYVCDNFQKLTKTEDFCLCPASKLEYYLRDERLQISEFKLYKALEKWVDYDTSKRLIHMEHFLELVRFAMMSNEELNKLRKRSMVCEIPLLNAMINEGMSFRCSILQKQFEKSSQNEQVRVRGEERVITFSNSEAGMRSYILMNGGQKWTAVRDAMEQPASFSSSSLCVINNFLFVCGGDGDEHTGPSCRCYCYRPYNSSWTRLSNMRQGRRNFALVAHGNMLYAVGGIGTRNRLTDNVEKYDILHDKWSYACAMGKGLSDMAHCTRGDVVFFAGGVDENFMNTTTFKTFLPKICMWQKRAHLLSVKFRPKLFSAGNDQILLMDMYKTDGVAVGFESYNIQTNQWTVLDSSKFRFSRTFSAVASQDWVYFVGRNEVEDGHCQRYHLVSGQTEDIANYPRAINAPLCCSLRIPFSILKSRISRK